MNRLQYRTGWLNEGSVTKRGLFSKIYTDEFKVAQQKLTHAERADEVEQTKPYSPNIDVRS